MSAHRLSHRLPPQASPPPQAPPALRKGGRLEEGELEKGPLVVQAMEKVMVEQEELDTRNILRDGGQEFHQNSTTYQIIGSESSETPK